MEATTGFIYVGKYGDDLSNRILIPNTEEALREAETKGYNTYSSFVFEEKPTEENPMPVQHGDLVLRIANIRNDVKGLEEARRMTILVMQIFEALIRIEDCDIINFQYFIEGSYGFDIIIPNPIYRGECGYQDLRIVHLIMLDKLFGPNDLRVCDFSKDFADRRFLEKHRLSNYIAPTFEILSEGHMLPIVNSLLPNGQFNIQISWEELIHEPIDRLFALTDMFRDYSMPKTKLRVSLAMSKLYDYAVGFVQRNTYINFKEWLSECEFIQHCLACNDLSDSERKALFRILAPLGAVGVYWLDQNAKECSWFDPTSVRKEIASIRYATDFPIFKGFSLSQTEPNQTALITCKEINEIFKCKKKCNVHTPVDLSIKSATTPANVDVKYKVKDDGLYYLPKDGDEFKVCSYIKVLGRLRDIDEDYWYRYIELRTPDNSIKKLSIPMKDLACSNEQLLGNLMENGLETFTNKPASYLKEYIGQSSANQIYLRVGKLGWHGNTYILPDEVFGANQGTNLVCTIQVDDYGVSGTLKDWQEHIGAYCQGNLLAEFVCQFALMSPLLSPIGIEGGGLHLYGPSSTGKTTLGSIAGSLFGGRANGKGYVQQWLTTPGAMERVATMHNDSLLVLDELGQTDSKTVGGLTYMLPNSQGKSRMRADSSMRPTLTWTVNIVSTGEVGLKEKIESDRYQKSYAGQEVRFINIPVDGGIGANIYSDLHGFSNPSELGTYLKTESRRIYGTPFRTFLKELTGSNESDLHANIEAIKAEMHAFVRDTCPKEVSGQVERVAQKFGLAAAVGKFATERGILPWSPEEARKATVRWFRIWLRTRGGLGNLEIIKAMEKIRDYFERYASSRFPSLRREEGETIPNISGYLTEHHGKKAYLLNKPTFYDLTKGVNEKELIAEMDKKGWLVHTNKGDVAGTLQVRTSISREGYMPNDITYKSVRGIPFVDKFWA